MRSTFANAFFNCDKILPLVLRTAIPWFAYALFAVLDGLHRAEGDAAHTVGAVLPPLGQAVHHLDVVQGAHLGAPAAAGAAAGAVEGFCVDEETVEQAIDQAGFQAVQEPFFSGRKGCVVLDGGDAGLQGLSGTVHDGRTGGGIGDREHGQVIFRHDHL